MEEDLRGSSRAVAIDHLPPQHNGRRGLRAGSSAEGDLTERESIDDDQRWFSADGDDDRTSVNESDVASRDDDEDDEDDARTLTPERSSTPVLEGRVAKKESGGPSEEKGSGAPRGADNHCRSSNDENDSRSSAEDDGPSRVDDLEGQEKPREPPDGGARAWLVACGAFASLVCTFGYLNTFGVFQSYYQRNQLANKWPSQIAWIGSTQVFLLFLGGLLSGPLADRYGFRTVFAPSALLLVAGIMLSSICTTYASLLITHGVIFGFASGMIFTPTVSVVGQYFTSKRASATGIAVSGASIGGIIFPLILDRLLNASDLGFGGSVRVIGGVISGLLLFTLAVTCEFAPRRKRRLFLPQAFHDSSYVLLVLGFFFTLLGFWTPIFYIVEYAQSKGVDATSAFYLVAIMNATSFAGRLVLSRVADVMGRFNANAILTACTAILIFTWTTAETKMAITIWIAFYGFFQGAVMLLISPCLAEICPRPSDIGTYVGMALACGSLGGLVDTPINGALMSRFGYFDASMFSGILVLVGATCYTVARLRIDRRLLAKV